MDRRCSVCHGMTSVYERYSVLLIPIVYRYRCRDCGMKMDLFSKAGARFMAVFAIGMPMAITLLPAAKFERASDRLWILVFVVAQGIVLLAMVARDRRRIRDNPPLDGSETVGQSR